MDKCVTGKRMYGSERLAEDVLLESWVRYDYRDHSGPVAVYRCDDCGRYHLTSKGPMNERLAEAIKDGSIEKQKRGRAWEARVKRR